MSTFSAALGVLGLSISEAAKYLNLPPSEIERLCTHGNEVTEATWIMMAKLYAEVLTGASIGRETIHDLGLQIDDMADFDMGHEGMPEGSGAAAGAMAVLDYFRDIKLMLEAEGSDTTND